MGLKWSRTTGYGHSDAQIGKTVVGKKIERYKKPRTKRLPKRGSRRA